MGSGIKMKSHFRSIGECLSSWIDILKHLTRLLILFPLLIFHVPEIYDENVLPCGTDVIKRLIFRPTWMIKKLLFQQHGGERKTFDIFWNRTNVFGQSLMKIPDNDPVTQSRASAKRFYAWPVFSSPCLPFLFNFNDPNEQRPNLLYRGISSGVEHLTPDQQVGRSIRSFLTLFFIRVKLFLALTLSFVISLPPPRCEPSFQPRSSKTKLTLANESNQRHVPCFSFWKSFRCRAQSICANARMFLRAAGFKKSTQSEQRHSPA